MSEFIECDFCSAMVGEAWVFGHGGFLILGGDVGDVLVEPGEMAACGGCRGFIEAKDRDGLMERVVREQGIERDGSKVLVAGYHAGVVERLTGAVQYVRAGDPKPELPKYFDSACRCGEYVERLDAESYERSVSWVCPKCGCETTVIGRAGVAASRR